MRVVLMVLCALLGLLIAAFAALGAYTAGTVVRGVLRIRRGPSWWVYVTINGQTKRTRAWGTKGEAAASGHRFALRRYGLAEGEHMVAEVRVVPWTQDEADA